MNTYRKLTKPAHDLANDLERQVRCSQSGRSFTLLAALLQVPVALEMAAFHLPYCIREQGLGAMLLFR
jgi:hypothetical protein